MTASPTRGFGRLAPFFQDRIWFLFALTFCLALDFCFARAVVPNSDTIQAYNEIPSVDAGNLLLRHWALASDNFYLTDLPIFTLFRFLIGDRPALTFIVPFFIFLLLLTACVLLVRGEGSRERQNIGAFLALFLLGLPFSDTLDIWFSTGIHTATLMFCLYAVLTIRPLLRGQPLHGVRLLLFSGLVAAAAASDPLTDAILAAPLLMLLVVRFWLNPAMRRQQVLLAFCLIAAIAAGTGLIPFVSASGGFTTNPSFTTRFIGSVAEMRSNMTAIRGALEILFSARDVLLRQVFAHQVVAACRLLTGLCVIILCIRILRKIPRAPNDGVAQCLVLGALCLLVLDAMSASFTAAVSNGATFPGPAIRYVVPAYLFGSVAACIEFQSVWAAVRWNAVRRSGQVIGFAFISLFVLGAGQVAASVARLPPGFARAPQAPLADWLGRHGFTYGLGDYWTTQMVVAITRGHVLADPVAFDGRRLVPFRWISDLSRVDRHEAPQFIAYQPHNPFGITPATVAASFGPPRKIYPVGDFIVVQLAAPGAPVP